MFSCKKSIFSRQWFLQAIKWLSESLRGLKKHPRSIFWVLFCGHAKQGSSVTGMKPSQWQQDTCRKLLQPGSCCFCRQLQTMWCLLPFVPEKWMPTSCHSIPRNYPGPCTIANAARRKKKKKGSTSSRSRGREPWSRPLFCPLKGINDKLNLIISRNLAARIPWKGKFWFFSPLGVWAGQLHEIPTHPQRRTPPLVCKLGGKNPGFKKKKLCCRKLLWYLEDLCMSAFSYWCI